MVRSAEILVLSTHDMRIVREWCSRVLWLDQGNLRLDGPPDSVADAYLGRTEQPAVAALAGLRRIVMAGTQQHAAGHDG